MLFIAGFNDVFFCLTYPYSSLSPLTKSLAIDTHASDSLTPCARLVIVTFLPWEMASAFNCSLISSCFAPGSGGSTQNGGKDASDTTWILSSTFLIFTMQSGIVRQCEFQWVIFRTALEVINNLIHVTLLPL